MPTVGSWYLQGMVGCLNGNVDLDTDTLKMALLTSSYTPAENTHDFFDDLTNEVTGTGYTAGGATLSSKSVTGTAANSWGTSWAGTTAYTVGKIVRPTTGNGYLYRCTTAGTSSGSEPAWPTVLGNTVTDGGVTWECFGRRVVTFDFDDVTWSTATITARYAVVYKSTGTASTSRLLVLLDFGSDVSSTSANFTVTVDAQGAVHIGLP